VFFDEIQVLYHTHFVTGFVSAVNGFQSVAWEASALKAESHFTI